MVGEDIGEGGGDMGVLGLAANVLPNITSAYLLKRRGNVEFENGNSTFKMADFQIPNSIGKFTKKRCHITSAF